MVRALNPELRRLIEAIESWPTAVSHAQRAAQKPEKGRAAPPGPPGGTSTLHSGDADAEEGEEAESSGHARAAAPAPRLSSSLRAPASRRLSSMASTVPQRDEEWRRSAIGPGLGPGAYDARPGGLEVRDAVRHSEFFRSNVPQRPEQLGRAGEVVPPESMYAHSSKPHKPKAILGVSPFNSTTLRFGVDGHLQSVRIQQLPSPRRRATSGYQGAPQWDAPYTAAPPPLVVPPDHAERLAAARASVAQ